MSVTIVLAIILAFPFTREWLAVKQTGWPPGAEISFSSKRLYGTRAQRPLPVHSSPENAHPVKPCVSQGLPHFCSQSASQTASQTASVRIGSLTCLEHPT